MAHVYNDPAGGNPSTVGKQARTDMYDKKALVEAAKKMKFMPMADVKSMPKHMGKKIIKDHYLPILSDANINDQGIDATGASTNQKVTYIFTAPDVYSTGNEYIPYYFVGEGVDATAANTDAKVSAEPVLKALGVWTTDYATTRAALIVDGWTIVDDSSSPVAPSVPQTGNLYGSSKDIGAITGNLPALTENGGRVNRVGFTRIQLEGTFEKFGFFAEYTKESMDFDSDAELEMHMRSEMLKAANEITEDALQIDLINGAGVIRYGGDATNDGEITGNNGATISEITYQDLQRLAITLNSNRCPRSTNIITGSRMQDTRTINNGRYIFIGPELEPTIRGMVDTFGNPAFISIEKYGAAAKTIANGEIGAVDQFRFIVHEEMTYWEGAGATVTTNDGYRDDGANYNVYPMLLVGEGSFTSIGFQTDGKTVKFKIKHRKPESEESYTAADPFGEKGFMSIKWYYGSMILRPERIALMKSVAPW
jgi:N4-gp56 family major capsid protein